MTAIFIILWALTAYIAFKAGAHFGVRHIRRGFTVASYAWFVTGFRVGVRNTERKVLHELNGVIGHAHSPD
jgi:hypothetical protein